MKMRWYDRILVSLGGLVLIGVGVLVVLSGIGVVQLPEPIAIDSWLGDGWQWMPIIFLVGLLFVAWGIHLLIRPLAGARSERKGKYYTVKTEDGDGVHISVAALDNLVHRCLEQFPEVLASQIRIGGQEDAMQITLRVSLMSDVRIPELLTNVRHSIRQYIEECSGVKVENVRVVVEATKDDKPRAAAKDKAQKDDAVRLLPQAHDAAFDVQSHEPEVEAPSLLKREIYAPAESTVVEETEFAQEISPAVEEAAQMVAENAAFAPEDAPLFHVSKDAFPFPDMDDAWESAETGVSANATVDPEDELASLDAIEEEQPDAAE